jgi:hypothetical protein
VAVVDLGPRAFFPHDGGRGRDRRSRCILALGQFRLRGAGSEPEEAGLLRVRKSLLPGWVGGIFVADWGFGPTERTRTCQEWASLT